MKPRSGMQAIAAQYKLKVNEDRSPGPFQWKRRMGIHMAFHQEPWNIAIHAFWSPINAWAVLLIFYPFQIPGLTIFSTPVNGAMLVLALVFGIYACMDLGAAIFTLGIYSLTYLLCPFAFTLFGGSALLMLGAGISLTLFSLAVQVYIGHGVAEKGIDDAFDNFGEFFESKNPLYLALLPFYTFADLMFRLGYRPHLARFIADITDELRPQLEGKSA